MNRIRVFTSGALFAFSIYCLLYNPYLPFQLPEFVYILGTLYFSFFPIKDMIASLNTTLYKGRQFKKNYVENEACSKERMIAIQQHYNKRALGAFSFWLIFLIVPGMLYLFGIIDRIWIFTFFCLSNFSVFFAIFGWCPFHSIFIKPDCCMECRIYNWDSFFQYSFLIFIPNIYTVILFSLGVASMIEWEIMHALHPEHFYKESNANLVCEHCDLDGCRKHKKKMFSKILKEEYKNDCVK